MLSAMNWIQNTDLMQQIEAYSEIWNDNAFFHINYPGLERINIGLFYYKIELFYLQ